MPSQYGLAEDTLRTGGSVSAQEVSPNELYSQSAIYIAAAHALKPNYSVRSHFLSLDPVTYFNHAICLCIIVTVIYFGKCNRFIAVPCGWCALW